MNKKFFFILIAVLAAKIAVAGFLYAKQISPSPIQDPLEYKNLGVNILENRLFSAAQNPPYSREILRTPAYPFFLALTFAADKSGYLAVFFQQLMIVFSGILLFLAIKKWAANLGGKWILGLFLFFVFDPRVWFWSLETMAEAFFIMLISLSLFFILYFRDGGGLRTRYVFVSGAFFGIAVLARPSGILFLPGLFLMLCGFKLKKKEILNTLIFVAISAVIVLPWIWRNYKLTGEPVLSSSSMYNYVLAFSEEEAVRKNCMAKIEDSKGRMGCLIRAYTADGFLFLKNSYERARNDASPVYFLRKNISGVYRFWLPADFKDIAEIAVKNFSGSAGRFSSVLDKISRCFYGFYIFLLAAVLFLAGLGLISLFKRKEFIVSGSLLAIIVVNTFLNYGIAYGRHHLPLLFVVFFLAAFGIDYLISGYSGYKLKY